MTIAAASPSQKTDSTQTSAGSSHTCAFPNNVASGSLVTVFYSRYNETGNDPPVVGDISKSSGTATFGTWTLDKVNTVNWGKNIHAAVFSAICTGSGSATIQVAGAGASDYAWIALDEYTGSWDSSRVEDSDMSSASSGTAVTSNDMTSAGAALFAGAMTHGVSGNPAITEDGAFTLVGEEENINSYQPGSGITRIVSSGTTDAASWTLGSGGYWVAVGVVYKEAAGGSNTTITPSNGSVPLSGATPTVTLQSYSYARPASDISEGWTLSSGVDSWDLLNETAYSDADYIQATAASQTTEVKLGTMVRPETNSSFFVNYRVQGITGGATVTVSLYCGATLIKTDTTRSANGDYTMTVAYADWDTEVTDWSDMRVRFVSG